MTTNSSGVNHTTIAASMHQGIISSFWTMLRECEAKYIEHPSGNALLKVWVEGWYRQWNEMTNDDKAPQWVPHISFEKSVQVGDGFVSEYEGTKPSTTIMSWEPRDPLPNVALLEESAALYQNTKGDVFKILAEQLGISTNDIHMEKTLVELGADSLDLVELVMCLEDHYSLEITDEDAENLVTVRRVVEYTVKRRLMRHDA